MKRYLTERIVAALDAAGIPAAGIPIHLERPKEAGHGDLATNIAMLLGKREKRNPRAIAETLLAHLRLEPSMIANDPEIAGPGFINFRFSDAYLATALSAVLHSGPQYGRSSTNAGRTINVEWVSANPTGPLHAGHGRQVCLGATLCSLLEWTGWTVTREYYFNNAGNQMNGLGLSVRARYRAACGVPFDESDIQYVGEYIQDIADRIRLEHGDSKLDADLSFFRKHGEEWCFAAIKKTLQSLNVHHDIFFNEDSLYSDGKIADVITELRSRDLVYDLDGAVWLKTTSFGADKDRVIVKGTGEPTYRLPDIAYHREKILRGYDRIVDIFGADHIATIPDVLATVKSMGLRTDHIDVVIHQMVSFVNEGHSVKMSKRSGNVYYLDDLIQDVGADAVRYFFVMRSANAHLEFDIALAQEQSEKNPVYYLQYASARIASILRFAESEGRFNEAGSDLQLLRHPSEASLIKILLEFPELVETCANTYETQHLCTYLHTVAAEFHKFYHDCRVVTEDHAVSAARLDLCRATRSVLLNGLSILGIAAPDRM